MKLSFDGYGLSADWASHVLRQVPLGDFEAVSFDDGFAAVRAVRVFGWVPRRITQIRVGQSGFFRGHVRFLHRLHRRGRNRGHLVIGMEAQQVEHCIFAQVIAYPRCHILDFLHGISDFRNNQVRDFDVNPVYLQLLQRLVNRLNVRHR